MFSKACEYAIRAVLYIAKESKRGNRTSLKNISREAGSPEAFTAKILQPLAKNNIIKSIKGPNGGFEIPTENLTQIKLADIVRIIDGDQLFTGCALGLSQCNEEKPCPLHDNFLKIRTEISELLETTNLNDITEGLNSGLTFLRR
ncbi:Rrf2 family transcriptional regulator [Echinicola jeungdonensis]|uniref:RrF2 family transcriptional regulator n=1 Tax=Echinicola jeungdonensis TaxID=709343 RepID=A0ABV5J2U5_9BACT|nr:Rrf2 family transcriptional regulator [Echinicola jeungdonensis]MDN3667995.1 Rrf2 family transcriptional regulator [Echinicola jeungdonensis]